jgi:hypothetical protein
MWMWEILVAADLLVEEKTQHRPLASVGLS